MKISGCEEETSEEEEEEEEIVSITHDATSKRFSLFYGIRRVYLDYILAFEIMATAVKGVERAGNLPSRTLDEYRLECLSRSTHRSRTDRWIWW